ncbi:MAG: flavin reductase family protein [Ruminococcaceae bacterium]|nr:flavin reductase family protein [Oscillospiraceae bacterium]
MPKVKWKGGALIAPLPAVLVTSGTLDDPNVFTVAWTGIINTQPPKTYISVRPSRVSYENIKKYGKFVINLTSAKDVRAVDFCGVRSKRNTDKFKSCGLSVAGGLELTDTPVIESAPLSLECVVTDIISLGTHDMFLADIVATDIDSGLINCEGKLRLDKANLLAYSHGEYFELGKKLGSFGYSVKKKRRNNKIKSYKK